MVLILQKKANIIYKNLSNYWVKIKLMIEY